MESNSERPTFMGWFLMDATFISEKKKKTVI